MGGIKLFIDIYSDGEIIDAFFYFFKPIAES
jgi:hypothetical protein